MPDASVTIRISWPWWFRRIYLPLTIAGAWLGLPLNPEIIAADVKRAARLEIIG